MGTLTEIETSWSIDDLYDANDWLDAVNEARKLAQKQEAEKRGRS